MSADFDKQIDRAVRGMLDVEPPADLRARVMAKLPASGSRLPALGSRLSAFGSRLSAAGSPLPAAGWALAAAAIVAIALFVARRSEPLPQAPVAARAVDRSLPPEAPRQSVDLPVVPTRPAPAVTRSAPREPNGRIVVAAALTDDEPETVQIAPLNTITPISVTPITQGAIAPADMAVRPLNTITEIQIAPLTPADRRD
jgi:hypothetical protein